jgi:alpha-beta hydrolase superfamily lysophospholipase
MIAFGDSLFDGQLLRTLGHSVYGGAAIGECLATAAAVADGDREGWYRAWTELADRSFTAAEASAAGGHRASAEGAFLRASNYYRNAYIFHLEAPLPAVALEAYRRQREAFARAAASMQSPLERLAIPFDGASLPGWFCPAGGGRAPVVISVGGYDSTAEESYFWNGAAARARGYHAVTFDGPGQGGVLLEQGVPFRPDWEKVISAVIDAVAKRPDVDAQRIAVVGESFGGLLAPRGAARDRRVAACVLDPAQMSLFRAFLSRLPLPASLKEGLPRGPSWLVAILRAVLARMARKPSAGWALRRGMLTHGVATPWDYFLDTARYETVDLVGEIRCPTLVCDAANDDISASARAFFEALTCEKSYVRFTAGEGAADHCVMGNRPLFHERIFDWLDERLAGASASSDARAA